MKFNSIRTPLFAALFATSTVLAACGGSSDSGDDTGGGTPTGDHNEYVVKKLNVPTNTATATQFGLDLDKDEPDGDAAVDNQLGVVLGALAAQNVDVQATIDASVNDGTILLLADYQTADFTTNAVSGFQMNIGDTATLMPAACTDPADPSTCGKHLLGTGTFDIAADSPNNAAVTGPVVGGTFNGGGTTSKISVQISLTGGTPLQLDLIGAKAKVTGASATGITAGVIAGAISKMDMDTKVLPAIGGQLGPILNPGDGTYACAGNAATMRCECTDGTAAVPSSASTVATFDTNFDCVISGAEIGMSAIGQFLLPDVTIDGVQALSLGVGFAAAAATVN